MNGSELPLWQVMLIYLLGLSVVLYLLVILPGKRKNKQTRAMHASVAPGDRITTLGGIIATVVERDGDTLTLLIDPKTGTTMQIVIYAVKTVQPRAESGEADDA